MRAGVATSPLTSISDSGSGKVSAALTFCSMPAVEGGGCVCKSDSGGPAYIWAVLQLHLLQ